MKQVCLAVAIMGLIGSLSIVAADAHSSAPAKKPAGTVSTAQRLSEARLKGADKMTDEQRKKLQDSNQKLRQEQTAVYEKLRAVRRDLEKAAQAENYDEQAIRAKAANIGQLEGDLAVIRAKHYQELRSIMPKPVTNATPAKAATILTNRPPKAASATK